MACNQCYPTNIENSIARNARLIGYFTNSIYVFLALHVCNRFKYQLQTTVRCISARQSYLCYIFYEVADNDIID